MRLLQRNDNGSYIRTPDLPADEVPSYAILSHTWRPDEVFFEDIAKAPDTWQQKVGYSKIQFCAEKAKQNGLRYFWVDTCCIDKSDSIELQTAINSMFRWYRNAERCYVYLSDVSCISTDTPEPEAKAGGLVTWEDAFRNSRWPTRGWTLQELLAPRSVDFYSRQGIYLGNKQSLERQLCEITGIPARALRGDHLSDFSIAEREAWIRNRQTKYEEDMVYSLLGIFGVYMPLIYGEGRQNAQKRLREEVQKAYKGAQHNEFSVTFSLTGVPEIQNFIARESELLEIHRVLSGSDGTRRSIVVHGLGGIGKTQLAITYAKRYKDEHSAIFWLNIKDEPSIQQSFMTIAKQIMRQHTDAGCLRGLNLQDNAKVIDAVKTWLSLPGNTRWLLIYDNYDDPKLCDGPNDTGVDIDLFLPEAYQGSVIVTTRSSQVNIGHSIRVKKLESIEDSLQILATTSGRNDPEHGDDAKRLAEELDGLPLALAAAGAYLRRVTISFADYLSLYKESWSTLQTTTPSLGSYQDRTLCSTWELSYVQIQKQHPLAAYLLRWWAYFNNEDLWFELLQHDIPDRPGWACELADKLSFNSAMGTLHDYGFVEPHTPPPDLIGSRGYSIHPCVHSWTVHVLNEERDVSLFELSMECIAFKLWLRNEHTFWLLERRLLPHAFRCIATISDGVYHNMGLAFRALGFLFQKQSRLPESEDLYLRAFRTFREEAKEPRLGRMSTLGILNDLGVVFLDQYKLRDAENMFLQTLQGYEEELGPDHESSRGTVHNLALCHAYQEKDQDAEVMFLRTLSGYQKELRPRHIWTFLSTINTLGLLYMIQGKLQDAEDMYLRGFRETEKASELDNPSKLDIFDNLEIVYKKQGKLQDAEDMYSRALRRFDKALDPQDLMTHLPALNILYNLAMLQWKQGRLFEAKSLLEKVLAGSEVVLGPSYPEVQETRDLLSVIDQEIEGESTSCDFDILICINTD
ncbi:kinesin light chain [Nemania sp. FL0916]|nr:kinesin light chain [Nemania sp. FL0916]